MTITLETYLLVSLAFAVFAAVVAVGSSLVLGASFERLKISFEIIQKQTGFFSDSLFRMEHRVDELEKTKDEQAEDDRSSAHVFITADDSSDNTATSSSKAGLWGAAEAEGVRFH